MTISPEFVEALAVGAAAKRPGPMIVPWPAQGMPVAFVTFRDFDEWRRAILSYRLVTGLPLDLVELFDRAIKLYLTAWLDFDLVTAAESAAFAALEFSLRSCYLGYFQRRHLEKVIARAESEKRSPELKENFKPQNIKLSDLLHHMVKVDGLTDEKLPCAQRTGGKIVHLLVKAEEGEIKLGLSDMRNSRSHGETLRTGYQSGLIDVVRDLIEYAYRDRGNKSE